MHVHPPRFYHPTILSPGDFLPDHDAIFKFDMVLGALLKQVIRAGNPNSSDGAEPGIQEGAALKEESFDKSRSACYTRQAFN